MVPRTYVIGQIEESDRVKNAWRIERAEERGDPEEAQAWRDSFAKWEKEQGEEKERLVCAICGSGWLTPTFRRTARPHRRDDVEPASWGTVRLLRKEIQTLQAELDRVLDSLEP